MDGHVNYYSGLAAEDTIALQYERLGGVVAARRWRGSAGEVDLIVRHGAEVVFVEVKKSRDFARAAERVSQRQMRRIWQTASEFIAGEPAGQDTPIRFDVALVNESGETDILRGVDLGH